MPLLPLGKSLRSLLSHTRARIRLARFRQQTLPLWKQRIQSRIYRYILDRQAQRLHRAAPRHGALPLQRLVAADSEPRGPSAGAMSYSGGTAPREPGTRRRKLAGYLKTANEIRQSYTQQYAPAWSRGESAYPADEDAPGSFSDAAVVRTGEEEMILFPSYARKHVKRKPQAESGTVQEVSGEGRDARDSAGAGDAEFWRQQWEDYEDDHAIVDVDVRGWIYTPFKGQLNRKQRIFVGLARQLVGIQAPPAAANLSNSTSSSRDPSPGQPGLRERVQKHQAQHDEILTAQEAEEILRRGEKEAYLAAQGAYSERPEGNIVNETEQLHHGHSGSNFYTLGKLQADQLSRTVSSAALNDEENITPVQKRASWNQPAEMGASELAEANDRLMTRLRHFLAVPMSNTSISIFFYNENRSKQRTIYTNPSGHFNMTAALDFVPTHIRVLASDKLSATEEVTVTDARGISVISDIDDTIKHSAISNGAREIFRNAFIRELGDLTIEGVREWYNDMANLGIRFHYVSNSPWQLYPVISKFFELAGLPPGSFHLKQYSGMLQGIFEPVAERKKVTLDKISRDFPQREFILIGDSGEADLEVYTDFVLENPGRVIAIFIRDVTTQETGRFFDPSIAPAATSYGAGPPSQRHDQNMLFSQDDDPELKAAISASLRDMDQKRLKRSKSVFPEMDTDHPSLRPRLPSRKASSQRASEVDLIDLSTDSDSNAPSFRRAQTDSRIMREDTSSSMRQPAGGKRPPVPPQKPAALRCSINKTSVTDSPPPPPQTSTPIQKLDPTAQQLSTSAVQSCPLGQADDNTDTVSRTSTITKGPTKSYTYSTEMPRQQTYVGMARDKLRSAYDNSPSLAAVKSEGGSPTTPVDEATQGTKRVPPPVPPPRRGRAAEAVSYAGSKASAAWQYAPSVPHSLPFHQSQTLGGASQTQASTRSVPRQMIRRTQTGSTLGHNGSGTAEGQLVNKREQMWRQRWEKAQEILHSKGVLLRSWRVGTDAATEAERIIRKQQEKYSNEDRGRSVSQ